MVGLWTYHFHSTIYNLSHKQIVKIVMILAFSKLLPKQKREWINKCYFSLQTKEKEKRKNKLLWEGVMGTNPHVLSSTNDDE